MRSIKANYEKAQARNQNLGVYSCLAQVVRSKKFSRKSLVKAFNELMPKDEYLESEKRELVDYLEEQTNLAEEGEIKDKNRL
jgi:hypothetical protein